MPLPNVNKSDFKPRTASSLTKREKSTVATSNSHVKSDMPTEKSSLPKETTVNNRPKFSLSSQKSTLLSQKSHLNSVSSNLSKSTTTIPRQPTSYVRPKVLTTLKTAVRAKSTTTLSTIQKPSRPTKTSSTVSLRQNIGGVSSKNLVPATSKSSIPVSRKRYDIKGRIEDLEDELNKNIEETENIKSNEGKSANEFDREISELQNKIELIKKQCDEKDAENLTLMKKKEEILRQIAENTKQSTKFKESSEKLLDKKIRLSEKIPIYRSTLNDRYSQIGKADSHMRYLNEKIQKLKSDVQVFCRFMSENKEKMKNIDIHKDNRHISVNSGLPAGKTSRKDNGISEFLVDRVFSVGVTQSAVFDQVKDLVRFSLDGRRVCFVAYGRPRTGKSYTFLGDCEKEQCGMIHLACDLIYSRLNLLEQLGWEYDITMSSMGIDAQVTDLLGDYGKSPLHTSVHVDGFAAVRIRSREQFYEMLTKLRGVNSRHLVLRVDMEGTKDSGEKVSGRLTFVELCSKVKINYDNSITEFENFILNFVQNKRTSAFGNCKLVKHLKCVFSLNCKVVLFVHVSAVDFTDMFSSLKFASLVCSRRCSSKVTLLDHNNSLRVSK